MVGRKQFSHGRICARPRCGKKEDNGDTMYKIPGEMVNGVQSWQCQSCYDKVGRARVKQISQGRICARPRCGKKEDNGDQMYKIPGEMVNGVQSWQCKACYNKVHRARRETDGLSKGHIMVKGEVSKGRMCARPRCGKKEDDGVEMRKIPGEMVNGVQSWQCKSCYDKVHHRTHHPVATADALTNMLEAFNLRTSVAVKLASDFDNHGELSWQPSRPYIKAYFHKGRGRPMWNMNTVWERDNSVLLAALDSAMGATSGGLSLEQLLGTGNEDGGDETQFGTAEDANCKAWTGAELVEIEGIERGHDLEWDPLRNEEKWARGEIPRKVDSAADLEDIRTFLADHPVRGSDNQPLPPSSITHGGKSYLAPDDTRMGKLRITILRTSNYRSLAQVNALHLTNAIVSNDRDAQSPHIPPPDINASLVFNGRTAWDPFPVYDSLWQTPEELQWILLLEQADRENRDVELLIRGIAGFSCWPNVYARIHERFPNLVVRIVYAVRECFVANANCCLPLHQQQHVPAVAFAPPTLIGLRYTHPINIRRRENQHLVAVAITALSLELLYWDDQEVGARTRRIRRALAILVLHIRGRARNRIMPHN